MHTEALPHLGAWLRGPRCNCNCNCNSCHSTTPNPSSVDSLQPRLHDRHPRGARQLPHLLQLLPAQGARDNMCVSGCTHAHACMLLLKTCIHACLHVNVHVPANRKASATHLPARLAMRPHPPLAPLTLSPPRPPPLTPSPPRPPPPSHPCRQGRQRQLRLLGQHRRVRRSQRVYAGLRRRARRLQAELRRVRRRRRQPGARGGCGMPAALRSVSSRGAARGGLVPFVSERSSWVSTHAGVRGAWHMCACSRLEAS